MTSPGAPLLTAITSALIALVVIGAAAFESVTRSSIDPALLVMATAVMATFFTGQAIRQVNGTKVEALTTAVLGIHSRLDAANVGPAKDGQP